MTDVVGVLVVGAGDMGGRHARGWARAHARVVGVVDPDRSRARHTADEVGAEAFPTLAAGLVHPDVTTVSVCTPTYLHADATVTALDAGKNVLCEKPAALTLEQGERMRAAERASGKRLRIGFMRRFDPASHRIQKTCRELGGPLLAQATIVAGIRPKLLMHDAHANGGPVIDMCCHVFDQWAILFGERPMRVRAHGYTFGSQKIELETIQSKALDTAFLTLEYPSGGVGQVQVSWGLPRGVEATETHVYLGPEGVVTVDWPGEVVHRDGRGTVRWTAPAIDPWDEEIAAFHDELTGRQAAPLATIEDGIAALRTSLAVLESVASGRDVLVDEISGELPEVTAGQEGGRA